MSNSQNDRMIFEYEIIDIDQNILSRLNTKLENREDLLTSANENDITPYHLTWIKSFSNFIEEIDPLGNISGYWPDHSDSLVKKWHHAQSGGNYSVHDKETRGLSENILRQRYFMPIYQFSPHCKVVKLKL